MPRLELVIRDPTSGQESAGRAYVIDRSGTPVFPNDDSVLAMRYSDFAGREEHFIVEGSVVLDLPRGSYSITVERGPEFVPGAATVELDEDFERVECDLLRWIDMNDSGWYSGDLHGHRHPEQTPDLARIEALNLATCVTSHFGSHGSAEPSPKATRGEVWLANADRGPFVSLLDAELERLEEGPGATIAVGLRSRMDFPCDAWTPLDTTFADRARAVGGHIVAEKPFWPIVPVLAVMDKL